MDFANLKAIIALATPPQPGTQPDPRGQMIQMIGTFALLGIVFYFLLIRPQQKKTKEHDQLMKTLRAGDKIVTTGGIIAVVVTVKEKSVTIRSADAKMEITKSSVGEVLERSEESSAS